MICPYKEGSAARVIWSEIVRELSCGMSYPKDKLVDISISALAEQKIHDKVQADDRAIRVIRDMVRRKILIKTEGMYFLHRNDWGKR